MRKLILLIIALFVGSVVNGQITNFDGSWTKSNGKERGRLVSVEVAHNYVIVTIEVEAQKALRRLEIYHTNNTYIVSNDKKILQLTGQLSSDDRIYSANSGRGWDNVGIGEKRRYRLYFKGHLPSSVTTISIIDYGDNYGHHGYGFSNYRINNTRRNYLSYSTESEIRKHIDQNNDGICGLYAPVGDGSGATLACVKNNGEYYLIYVSSPSSYSGRNFWQVGDIKAKLQRTASGIFIADTWWNSDNASTASGYVAFDGVSMDFSNSNGKSEIFYLKTYPYSSSSSGGGSSGTHSTEWTGTGFALNNGYVVTNYHVVDGATSISVVGVNGKNTELKAQIVSVDSKNDLALIRITDSRFTGFGSIPYSVKNSTASVGSDIFVLGYPLTYYMGDEIKLTNGIISSNSGYKGDITTYQISAPVQPGNSGGPLFDKDGNVIGIVNAGIPDAENVGYAIKTTYLYSLISNSVSTSIIPSNNYVAGRSLPDKVKVLRNYVFFIKCH